MTISQVKWLSHFDHVWAQVFVVVIPVVVSFAQTLRVVCLEAISDCTILVLSMQVEQNAVKPMFKKNTYHINHLCH